MFYPMLMQPVLHARIWGGTKLRDLMGKIYPDDQRYGESWEVHDTSVIANGSYAGETLGSLIGEYGTDIVGDGNDPAEGLPLLLKLLDSSDWLSIQVHPNDEQARELEGDPRGKSEAWIVLQADADAEIIAGLKPGITRERLAAALASGTGEEVVVKASVRTGDVIYLAANAVHALGKGLLIYEIQQSSDITYRLYDWGRLGVDGKPRTLHLEKGLAVADYNRLLTPSHPGEDAAQLLQTPYFVTHRRRAGATPQTYQTQRRFHTVTCTAGTLRASANDVNVSFGLGQTVFIPASLPEYTLSGDGVVLVSHQPTS
jgi:mannose-6-phosphate isomerase